MRNALYATSGLALAGATAVGSASAADMLSVGVGGYMQQWFGMSSVDDTGDKKGNMVDGGTAQQSDSEIFFKGKLESDSGLTFSVKVELEGNNFNVPDGNSTNVIDESQLTVSGSFGQVTLGAEDPASTLTHHGGLDVGVTLNCGDTHKWINGLASCSHNGFGTAGHGHGDRNNISYFTPRVSGIQFGASYIPDTGTEASNKALKDNENDAWSVGGNYVGDFGGANVAFSLGHYQASRTGKAMDVFDGMNRAGDTPVNSLYRLADYKDDDMAIMNAAKALAGDTKSDEDDATPDTLEDLRNDAADAKTRMGNHMTPMMKADDKTFSNAALQVGFGSFSFGVVYATNDGGAYKVVDADRPLTASEFASLQDDTNGPYATSDSYDPATGVVIDVDHTYDVEGTATTESTTANDMSNDNPMIRMTKLAEDKSANWDTWGAGVKYSEGPMAVSLSHLATEWDNGDEQDATMLSMSYTLAPGVASKTSIVSAERSYGMNSGDNSGRTIEGTAFVTGFALSF